MLEVTNHKNSKTKKLKNKETQKQRNSKTKKLNDHKNSMIIKTQ